MNLVENMTDPLLIKDASAKRQVVRLWLEESNLDGVIISRRDNFAWITCGGDSRVVSASHIGVGHIVITRDKHYLVAYHMDSDRMIDDQMPGQGYEQMTLYWHEGDERIKARELAGIKVAADTFVPGTEYMHQQIEDMQWPLTEIEVTRTRWLAKQVSEILEKVFLQIQPGMKESEIAKMVHMEVIQRGIDLEVPIIGSDERIHKYRHVLATDKVLERYLLIGPVVQRWGLHCLVSRSAHFGEPPADVQKAFHIAATIEGRVMTTIKEGLPFSKILKKQKQWYEELGVPDGWNYHFQGGPTGYPLVASHSCLTQRVITVPQPFSWYTTVKGAKVEECTLLTENGLEIPSLGNNWPTIKVDTDKGPFSVPGMLIR